MQNKMTEGSAVRVFVYGDFYCGGGVYRRASCRSEYAGDDLLQRAELSADPLCRDSVSRRL